MRSAQRSLFDKLETKSQKRAQSRRLRHGGDSSIGKRKLARPLATKKWIHLTLKSDLARGHRSLLHYSKWIDSILTIKAKKFGLEIRDFVNMGNHLHIKLRAVSRIGFQNFLRSVTSLIARKVTGARKGKPFGKFWNSLAFTRVLTTSFEVLDLSYYFEANRVHLRKGKISRESCLRSMRSRPAP